MAEVRVIFETDEEKNRVEFEAKKLGLTQTALLRLLFLNWVGEIKLERTESPNKEKQGGD